MKKFSQHTREYIARLQTLLTHLDDCVLDEIASAFSMVYEQDSTIYIIGNGGSASTASHMSADLCKGTSCQPHRRLRVVSLTDNMAWFSAIANDIGYEEVFTEQLRSILRPEDLLVAISASGNSPNVVGAVAFAKSLGTKTISLVGFHGGKLKETSDIALHLPSRDYGTIEDAHLILNHVLVEFLRDMIKNQKAP